MSKHSTDVAISRFSSKAEDIRNAPEPRGLRFTVFTLASLLVASIAFASVAKVDRVVTSDRGKIVPAEGTTLFQALDTSLIKTLDVREGDNVKKGQRLATLDPTFAMADVEQLEKQLASLDAQIARASAEQRGEQYSPPATDPARNQYVSLQKSLFDQRAAQFKSQTASFDEKISQTKATIKRLEGDQMRLAEREKISQQIENMRQQLVEKQAGSILNLLIASDARLEMLRTIDSTRNNLVEAKHQLASLQADRAAFIQQWMATSSQDLVSAQGARDSVLSQLSKATRHKDLIELTAPEDGTVLTRANVSVGSVLQSGSTLMTLVAANAPIEAEINISAKEVGFIRPGDTVTVKVDAFPYVEHGVADGRLSWVSEGAFTLDSDNKPVDAYYKARIKIEKLRFVRVPPSFRLIPGMSLTADIHIGERSVLGYVLNGATRGVREAMREP